MTSLRDRFFPQRHSVPSQGASQTGGDSSGSTKSVEPPFAGYEGLNDRDAMDSLSDHTQAELEVAEDYERAHQNRLPVLDKLRYMRGRQPMPGYDDLSTEEVVAALEDADIATIKAVRGYERKFANRPDVLDEVTRVHHRHLEAHPPAPPPAYQSASANAAEASP
jgi:hypothetical protein